MNGKPSIQSEDTMTTPDERRMLFAKGFGDGAKGSAQKHPTYPDYMEGWSRGLQARREGVAAYCTENDLPLGSPFRAEG